MNRNYWLHRISHEAECSYPLLEKGYLTIGWQKYTGFKLLNDYKESGEEGFNRFISEEDQTNRSRYGLKNFIEIQPGDKIVVPLYNKKIAIYEAIKSAEPISELPIKSLKNWNNEEVELIDGMLVSNNTNYDLGFFIEVRQIGETKDRNLAKSKMISRMKIRSTNAKISDLATEIDQIPSRKKKEYFEVKKSMSNLILNDINENCSDRDFEKLVLWYMEKMGADAYIPSKKEKGKTDKADADVIAEFERLKVIIYIQVKKHEGKTSDWAIEQITRYSAQMQDENSEYTYINWVISTAQFSDVTIEKGKEKNVYLINGNEFAERLIDIGLSNIDDFMNTKIKHNI